MSVESVDAQAADESASTEVRAYGTSNYLPEIAAVGNQVCSDRASVLS